MLCFDKKNLIFDFIFSGKELSIPIQEMDSPKRRQ